MKAGWAILGCVLASAARAEDSRISITDVSPAFAPGPYTVLRVDPRNPQLLAVGTQDGVVSWSNDSGASGHQATVLVARNLVFMGFRPDNYQWVQPLRSNGFAFQPLVSPSWNPTAASSVQALRPASDIAANAVSVEDPKANAAEFATDDLPPGDRLFMNLLNAGKPTLRWQRWMAVDDTQAAISDLAFSGPTGKMLVASSQGIEVSDRGRGAWMQAVGVPHLRRSSLQEYDPDGVGTQGTAVAVDPGDPTHMLAGTSAGLLVSTNGGESFFPHLDPKLADDPIYHLIWSAENPDRILALGARSVLISKDRGKTFTVALSTSSDLNALTVGPDATYAATRDSLLQIGFDGSIKKLLKDEPVVGVLSLGQGLLLVATEQTLEVLQVGNADAVVLKRAHPADPFLGLAGSADLSYALTKNGIYRISARQPSGPAQERLPRLNLSLAETERQVIAYQHLVSASAGRFVRPNNLSYLVPQLLIAAYGTLGQVPTVTQSGLLTSLAYSQASSTAFGGFTIFANLNFSRLPSFLFGRIPNPLNMLQQNLRPIREDILGQVRWRYRDCEELIRALALHPPADPGEEILARLRISELAAYLEAMAGEPVVAPFEVIDDGEVN